MIKRIIVLIIAVIVFILALFIGGGILAVKDYKDQISMAALIAAEDEERSYSSSLGRAVGLNSETEALRGVVAETAARYGIADYVDLLLAIVMRESGGRLPDCFQASESLGLPPNTISRERSVEQGVKRVSELILSAGVTSPSDEEHIRLMLQAYNFGNGYVNFALSMSGGWSRESADAYAEKYSGGVKRSGKRADSLGIWNYGDQNYTDHVLQYYSFAEVTDPGLAGAVQLSQRAAWLFPSGLPASEGEASTYMTTISVPCVDTSGNVTMRRLTCHKMLAVDIYECFAEMADAGFPVYVTSCYCWRNIRGSNGRSSHSYGTSVDINYAENPRTDTYPNPYQGSPYAVTDEVVAIWAEHGFYWGGDFKYAKKDYMHFTYTNQ